MQFSDLLYEQGSNNAASVSQNFYYLFRSPERTPSPSKYIPMRCVIYVSVFKLVTTAITGAHVPTRVSDLPLDIHGEIEETGEEGGKNKI